MQILEQYSLRVLERRTECSVVRWRRLAAQGVGRAEWRLHKVFHDGVGLSDGGSVRAAQTPPSNTSPMFPCAYYIAFQKNPLFGLGQSPSGVEQTFFSLRKIST